MLNTPFSAWFLRSYVSLENTPCSGILHPYGVDYAYARLRNPRLELPRIQAVLMPSFRTAMLRKIDALDCDVKDPRAVPAHRQSSHWQYLCEFLEKWPTLSADEHLRVLILLGKLCMYDAVLMCGSKVDTHDSSQSETHAQIAYQMAQARYVLWLDQGREAPGDAFARLVTQSPAAGLTQIHALYQLCIYNSKHVANLSALKGWLARSEAALDAGRSMLSDAGYALLRSRYHRVAGFAPQMAQDPDGVRREMDLAELWAERMPATTAAERIARQEMLYPVLESRAKEARWCGDTALALERSEALVALAPLDARARLHLGELRLEQGDIAGAIDSYRWATRLAPPGEEIAWFMLGQCYESNGERDTAFDAYMQAMRLDSGAVSAAQRIDALAHTLARPQLTQWAVTQSKLLVRAAGQEEAVPAYQALTRAGVQRAAPAP